MKKANRFRIAALAMLPLIGLASMAQNQKAEEDETVDKTTEKVQIPEKSIIDEVIWVVGDEACWRLIIQRGSQKVE